MNVKKEREGLHFLFAEFLVSPYGTKIFSFWIQKFSGCIRRSRKMSLELEVLTSNLVVGNVHKLVLCLGVWYLFYDC